MIGALERDGRSNDVFTVDVYGKMTLKEAFEAKLREKGLHTSNLEFLHPGISWDSPAYTQKVGYHI